MVQIPTRLGSTAAFLILKTPLFPVIMVESKNGRRPKTMLTDRESNEIKKSMAYDLIQIIEENPEQETYTADEVKKMIKTYIISATSK